MNYTTKNGLGYDYTSGLTKEEREMKVLHSSDCPTCHGSGKMIRQDGYDSMDVYDCDFVANKLEEEEDYEDNSHASGWDGRGNEISTREPSYDY